jgi:hypothetical protein
LASPGTPIKRPCPPARSVTSDCSITSSWPKMTFATVSRTRARRAAVASSRMTGVSLASSMVSTFAMYGPLAGNAGYVAPSFLRRNKESPARESGQIMSNDFSIGLASLQRDAAAGRGLPPVENWNPSHCGTIDIRIARDGTWFHLGTPIGRKELVRLFSTILRRDPDGYHLVTPAEKMRITVDDAPFLAVLLNVEGSGKEQRLTFITNVGDETIAGPQNAIRVETDPVLDIPAPYVHVRRGLEARISRTVFYQLVDLAVPGRGPHAGLLGVWSDGIYFPLGKPG